MKKRFLAAVLVAVMATSMTACSNESGNEIGTESALQSTENGTETEFVSSEAELAEKYSFISYSGKASNEFELNLDEIIEELPEYKNLEFNIDPSLEVTDAAVNTYLTNVLTQFGAVAYKEVTDRDVVEENDYVMLDYTGYKDDVAFDGGAATDVMIDVANNMQVGASYGFIDGFTSGIPGAKVGETIKCPVTFPENYGNEELNGQEVIFEFNIKAIYSQEAKTIDDLSDDEVNEIFGDAGFSTNASLKEQLVEDLEYQLQSEMVDKVTEYLEENSKVNIPSDYLDARCSEMLAQAKASYSTDTQTLEELVVASGMEYEEYIASLQEAVQEQIILEILSAKIAELENLTLSDDEFNTRVTEVIAANSDSFADESALYSYFGGDDLELGKVTFRNQILLDKISKHIADNSTPVYAAETTDAAEETATE